VTGEVVIVGAGPTGLLLAGDLAAAGVACTVLERRERKSNLTRAFAVHARTLELLDARGLADELIATGTKAEGLRVFGGALLDFSELATRFPFVLVTPQYNTERLLARRARELGATILPGVEVTGLRQDEEGVDVLTASGAPRRAAYVVGADGVRSTVRHAVGLGFRGRSAIRSVALADVRLTRAPDEVLSSGATGDAFALIAPFGDGWYRVIAWDRHRQLPDTAPVDFDELRAITRRALGTDYGVHDPRWMSRFHSDERQVEHYRVGRVFLAGDAAHVHSPAGGLGMNTGLQDAANLSWKLAAAIHDRAPVDLLDTYHTERHPIGRTTMLVSGALLRTATARSPTARAILATATTRIPALRERATGFVSGLAIAYPGGVHRAPDVALADGRRLYQALRKGCSVLVEPSTDTPPDGSIERVAPADGVTRMLVRPDGYQQPSRLPAPDAR
jgi:2-polyprenyl-6-methoxyphenol hydroxylase-like FAD-dependent oxidoreductase